MRHWPKIIIAFVSLLQTHDLKSQQDPMYSMYMFDKLLINPGFTGSSNWAVTTVKHRDQYQGVNGRPVTQTLNFHSPLKKRQIGIGLKLIHDKIAVQTNLNAALLLAYHLNMGGGKLSLGFEGGVLNRRMNYQDLITTTQGDNLIPNSNVSLLTPDVSAGLFYQNKQFYMGVSNYHLLSTDTTSFLAPHYYFIIGNVFQLGKQWTLEPSSLVKYQEAGLIQVDVNLMTYFRDVVGLGVQYRTDDAVAAVLRVNITQGLRIAYSFDQTISNAAGGPRNSHEIILSYGIKLLPPAIQKEIHPRYYF
jgi:type IX secretion system PorP/SprF family membrane protein